MRTRPTEAPASKAAPESASAQQKRPRPPASVALARRLATPVVFTFTVPDDAPGGDYTAVLHGYVDGERILPETYYFEVIARSRVYLPALRRRE